MFMRNLLISNCLLLLLSCGVATAQELKISDKYHPFMSDTFNLALSAYQSRKNFEIRVDGSMPGDNIDFDEALNLDNSELIPTINFRWRYTDNWSLFGQFWAIDSEGSAILEQDVEWNDVIFQAGTSAESGVKTSIVRVFFGRSFLKNSPGQELGIGAGIHWMEIDAFIQGQAIIAGGPVLFQREAVSASVPLPNLGAWYMYSWSQKWMVHAGVDWLSVSLGDYSGGLLSGLVGINYQLSKTFGLGLSYYGFGLNVDATSEDLHGRIETSQHGPRVSLSASW